MLKTSAAAAANAIARHVFHILCVGTRERVSIV